MMKTADPVVAKAKAERRRFRRVRVDCPARLFVPSDAREAECKIVDLSPGGASVECAVVPDAGTQIVLYVDGFGRFEGTVARREGAWFGVKFAGTHLKRERTAELLTLHMNKSLVDEADMRRHDRQPAKGFARFTRFDGSITKCEVLDLSTSGVSLKTAVRPAIGEFVLIGHMAGRVARHHADGVGIEFVGLGGEKHTTDQLHFSISAGAR